MVTMTDLKKTMAKLQRDYKSDEYYVPGTQLKFDIEFNREDGGTAKFITDDARNWFIDFIDIDCEARRASILVSRYADADEEVE